MSAVVVIDSLPHQTTQEEIAERFRGFKGFLSIRIYYNDKQESLTAEVEFTSFELAEFAKKTVQAYNAQLRMHVEFRENYAQQQYPEYPYQPNQQQSMAYQQPAVTLPPSLGVSSQYSQNDSYLPNPPYGQHLSQNPQQQQYGNVNSYQVLNPSSLPPPPPPPTAQIYSQNPFQEQQQQIRHMPYAGSSSQQSQFQQPVNPPPPPMLPPQQIPIDTYPTNSSQQQYSHPSNVQPIRPSSSSSNNYHAQNQSNNSTTQRQFQTPQAPQTRVSQYNSSNSNNIQQQQKQPQYSQPSSSSSYPEKQHKTYPDNVEDNLGHILLSEIKATSSEQMKAFRNSEGQTNSLYVDGIPIDSTEREVSHIFRPYPGFIGVRLIRKKTQAGRDFYLCFVDFVDAIQASIAHKTLQGYRFDKNDAVGLKISFANEAHQVKKPDNHKSQIYNSFQNAHSDDYDQGRNSSQTSRNSFGSSHHHKNDDHRYDDFRDKQRGLSRRN